MIATYASCVLAFLGSCALAQTGPCDPRWQFGLDQGVPGVKGQAYAVTTWDPDAGGPLAEWLVIGGGFSVAGDIWADNLVAWDGSTWHNLGGGVQGTVHGVAVFGGDLIVGGNLWHAGPTAAGTPISGIARFDGAAWHSMDGGLTAAGGGAGVVWALAVYQGEMIAAGAFENGSGLLTDNIARWNGTAWEALGFGIDGQQVNALAVLGDDLYAGGLFHTAGVVSSSNIARWDGFTWNALGSGTNAEVWALAPRANGTLAVGGGFVTAGGAPAGQLAIWAPQGSGAWQNPFGDGVGGGVFALRESAAGHLLIGGAFSQGLHLLNIMSWSTSTGFRPFGLGADGAVWDINMFDGRPVIAGGFAAVGPFDVPGNTTTLGVAIFNSSLCPIPSCAIVGGWERLTPGIEGQIHALGAWNGEVIMGGTSFSSAGMANVVNMARWDGEDWSRTVGAVPGTGTPGTSYGPSFYPWQSVVRSIISHQGSVIAGGQFNDPSFLSNNITSWHGSPSAYWGNTFFHALAGSQDLDNNVNAVCSWDPGGPGPVGVGPMIVAGGDFTTAGRGGLAVPASHIAGYQPFMWTAFGGGTDGPVHALTVYQGDLIVGGNFTFAGNAFSPLVARLSLTGTPAAWTWTELDNGLTGVAVLSLAVHNGDLYAGGLFSAAGPVTTTNIARWDGAAGGWHALGDGLGHPSNSPVYALASYRGDLYAGGSFTGSIGGAGAVLMNNIGRWDGAGGVGGWHELGGTLQGGALLGGGLLGQVTALAEYRGRLIVAGGFTNVDGRVSHNWARWEPDVIAPVLESPIPSPSLLNRKCGESAGMVVTATWGTTPAYQWRRNGVPLTNGPTPWGSIIENADEPGLSILNLAHEDAGQYDCVISNVCGSVTSSAATLSICYGDCTCNGQLSIADFACFQSRFVSGDPFADCNGNGFLTIADFACFQSKFAQGCP